VINNQFEINFNISVKKACGIYMSAYNARPLRGERSTKIASSRLESTDFDVKFEASKKIKKYG